MDKLLNPLERNELEKAMLGRGVEYDTIQLILSDFDARIKHLREIYGPTSSGVEAEWVYDHWCEFKCSNCGTWSTSQPYRGTENYCPECGAKMTNKW